MSELIQHYEEDKKHHSVDEIVMTTEKEHLKLLNRLKQNKKYNDPNEFKKAILRHYRKKQYNNLSYVKQARLVSGKQYRKKFVQEFRFTESFGKNTTFNETIRFNNKTGTVSYNTSFKAQPKHTLPVINID